MKAIILLLVLAGVALLVLVLASCGGDVRVSQNHDGGAADAAPPCACAVATPMPCVCGFDPSKASQPERDYCACVVAAVCSGKTNANCFPDAKR